MAAVAQVKKVGAEFKKSFEIVHVVYDYAVDGGAIGTLNLLQATGACVVKMLHAHIKTAVTSSGALTADLGKSAGTDFWSNKAVAALTLNSMHAVDAIAGTAGVVLADGETVDLKIEAFAATAGKIEFVFAVMAV